MTDHQKVQDNSMYTDIHKLL